MSPSRAGRLASALMATLAAAGLASGGLTGCGRPPAPRSAAAQGEVIPPVSGQPPGLTRARRPVSPKLRGDDRLCPALPARPGQPELHDAPGALRHRLPGQVSGIAQALARPQAPGQQAAGAAAEDYLRAALAAATSHVYAALTAVAALTFAAALLIMPRRFSTEAGESAATGPGGKTE